MTEFLVARLSISVYDEDKLKEDLQNGIQSEYSEYSNPIHLVYLLEPKIVVIYAQKGLIDSFLSRSRYSLQLRGQQIVTFLNDISFSSNCISVAFESDSELTFDRQFSIINTIRETFQLNFAAFMTKKCSFTLRFGTIEEAATGCQTVLKFSNENSLNLKSCVINIMDHVVLKCTWRGNHSLTTTSNKLKSTNQNLVNLVQSCLSIWNEQPVVLSLQQCHHSSPADKEYPETRDNEALLLCASSLDASILSSVVTFEVVGGSYITIQGTIPIVKRHEQATYGLTKSLDSKQHRKYISQDIYILWDFDSCPLPKEDDANKISENICDFLKYHISVSRDTCCKNLPIMKFVYLANETDVANHPSIQQLLDLNANGFHCKTYIKKNGIDLAMRTEIDNIINRYNKNESEDITTGKGKPFIVLITGDRGKDFNPTIARLRLESYDNVILIHNRSSSIPTSSQLASNVTLWSIIRKLHTFTVEHREEILYNRNHDDSTFKDMIQHHASDNTNAGSSQEIRTHSSSPSSISLNSANHGIGVNNKDRKNLIFSNTPIPEVNSKPSFCSLVASADRQSGEDHSVILTIELQWLVVAIYFKNLITWAELGNHKKYDVPEHFPKIEEIVKSRNSTVRMSTNKCLIGELDQSTNANEKDKREDALSSQSNVTLIIEPKEKRYKLQISAATVEVANKRHKSLMRLISGANKDRKLHTLPSNWTIGHRECILNSLPLLIEERNSEATALFHYKDGTVIAEIVSLNSRHHKQLLRFIETIEPVESHWPLSKEVYSIPNEKVFISELQYRFAVILEKTPTTEQTKLNASKTLFHVRGFSSLIQQAFDYVFSAQNKNNIVNSTTASTIKKPVDGSHSVTNNSLSRSAATTTTAVSINHTHHDAGINVSVSEIYEFQCFLPHARVASLFYHNFKVEINVYISQKFNCSMVSTMDTDVKSTINNANERSCFRLYFRSNDNDLEKISNCKMYLEKFSNPNLFHQHQIYFPKIDQIKYKSILTKISQQTRELQVIRQNDVSDNSLDPLHSIGFICTRIKPLISNKDIEKYSFPINACITVTTTIQTSENQKSCFRNVVKFYESIECGHYMSCLDIPPTSSIIRQLIMRNSREEFMSSHQLIGLRYEISNHTDNISRNNPHDQDHLSKSTTQAVVKLYATSMEIINKVMRFMEEHGAQNPRIIQNPHLPSLPSVEVAVDESSKSSFQQNRRASSNSQELNQDSESSASSDDYNGDDDDDFTLAIISSILLESNPPSSASASILSMSIGEYGDSNVFTDHRNGLNTSGVTSHLGFMSTLNGASNVSGGMNNFTGIGDNSSVLLGSSPSLNHLLHTQHFGDTEPASAIGLGVSVSPPSYGVTSGAGTGSSLLDFDSSMASASQSGLLSSTMPHHGNNSLHRLNANMDSLHISSHSSNPPAMSQVEKRVIRWPHHSFRFMFLGEPLKQSLLDLLTNMREIYGISTTYPHRDKSDHSACLLLEGSHSSVVTAADDLNRYMKHVYQHMRCLQFIISETDKKELISNDLNRVKDIQGHCGVHLVLDPLPTDMNEASATYDLRLPFTNSLLFENFTLSSTSASSLPINNSTEETDKSSKLKNSTRLGYSASSMSEDGNSSIDTGIGGLGPLREILSVVTICKQTGQNVIVSVVDNESTYSTNWNWDVSNILLMVDLSVDGDLNSTEIEQLDNGEVLVNTENLTGKRILRVRPERSSFKQGVGIEQQAESFATALTRGLIAADSLGMSGIAVVAPTGSSQYFSDLSIELIQTLTMEAVVAFVKGSAVRYINKILCIEINDQNEENMTASQKDDIRLLLPASANRMALTLLILLEQANDSSALQMNNQNHSQGGRQGLKNSNISPSVPTMQLRICNTPLPRNIRAEDLHPSLNSASSNVSHLLTHQIPPVNTSPIILRGLPNGIRAALKTIKNLINSYAENRKIVSGNMNSISNTENHIMNSYVYGTSDSMRYLQSSMMFSQQSNQQGPLASVSTDYLSGIMNDDSASNYNYF